MALAGAPQANISSWKFGGGIRFYDVDDSHYAGIKATATITGSIDYTLPVAPPIGDGYRLIATTAGIMSWANGANLTASTGISITSGSGTAALLVAATLAIDQAFTPTWTGLHTYTTNGVKFNFTNAGDTVLSSFVGAASIAAFLMTTDGTMFWGPGSGAVDAALNRTSAGVLTITGNLDISGLTASRVLSTDSNGVLTSVGAPASNGYVLSSTTAGVLSWVANGAPAAANLTVSTGLSITAGSGTNALLVAATIAVDETFSPTWTGSHDFDVGNVDFRSTAAYSTPPVSTLTGNLKINSGGTFSTLAHIRFGKENATDGNDAGFIDFYTRPNGGGQTKRLGISSAGLVNISGLTAGLPVFTDGSKNLVSVSTIPTSVLGFGTADSTTFLRGDSSWEAISGTSGGNPTASVGLSAVNGSATTYLRSDGAPALSQSIAPDWTGFHSHKFDSMGTTQDDTKGILLYNTTAAAAGAQQISPALRWRGQGWKTDATAASQQVAVRAWLLPVQDAANPSGVLKFQSEINDSDSFTDILTVTTAGLLTVPSAKVHAGTSSDRARVGGNLYSDYTNRSSNVGSGAEEDLGSFTVKDGTFATDGDSLYFSFSGAEGGSGLTKVLKVYVDGVSIYSFTTALTGDWIIGLTLVRSTSSNLKFSVARTSVFGGTALSEVLNGNATFSGDAIVKLTHTTTLTGTTPYSTEYFMLCDYMPAA